MLHIHCVFIYLPGLASPGDYLYNKRIKKSGGTAMGRYRIMIVDDEQEVRQAMIRKLDWEALGFQVVLEAENGQDLSLIHISEPTRPY